MKRTAWGNGYSGISVVLVVEEVALVLVEIVMPTVVLVVVVEEVMSLVDEVVPFVEVAVVVSVVVLLLMLMKSSLMFAPVNDTVFVIEPKPEPEAVTVIVPERPIGNA